MRLNYITIHLRRSVWVVMKHMEEVVNYGLHEKERLIILLSFHNASFMNWVIHILIHHTTKVELFIMDTLYQRVMLAFTLNKVNSRTIVATMVKVEPLELISKVIYISINVYLRTMKLVAKVEPFIFGVKLLIQTHLQLMNQF